MNRICLCCCAALMSMVGVSTQAALVLTQVDSNPAVSGFADDGVIGMGEYSAVFANGAGSGFGGTVGASTIYMDAGSGNLNIGFDPGADLNDLAILYLDTRAGGFLDGQMNDRADGGRSGSSNLTNEVDDQFPIRPDFAVVFGNFGTVVFELNAFAAGFDDTPGNPSNGHLGFQIFEGDQTSNLAALVREIGIPLALLGNPTNVDFFVAYTSDSNFNSNESLPGSALNAGVNPGFANGDNGGGPVVYDNFNRFSTVPEPSTAVLAMAFCAAIAATRRARG